MKIVYVLLLAILFGLGCKEEDKLVAIDENAPAPAAVSNVNAVSTEGGALISYKIPIDPNLSYVKAVYDIQPGVTREAKSSVYGDTLRLVGYGDTLTHEVKIYSVGKNEKTSEPVMIKVTPKKPPVRSIFETVDVNAAFGGVNVSFNNTTKAKISIELYVDSTGKNTWAPLNIYYTSASSGRFSVRGMKSLERRFAVLVRDRWNNKSDTLIKKLTPKFEIEIPKVGWVSMRLPTDSYTPANAGYSIEKLWDGLVAPLQQGFASANGSAIPSWFSIDLGKKVLLSRFKEHQAAASHLYVSSAVKRFELYGSNNPNADGSWASWTLLGNFESYKPSGLPMGQITEEDKNYANFLGEDFEFQTQPAAYRYYRWKTLETYSSTGQIVILELDFFGEIQP